MNRSASLLYSYIQSEYMHTFHSSTMDNATLRTQHSMTMDPYENDLELSYNMTTSQDNAIPQSSKPLTRSISEGNSLLRTRLDMFEVSFKTSQLIP